MPLKQTQRSMLDYLLGMNEGEAIAGEVIDQGGMSALERLAIYKNAYFLRLRGVIDQDHPELGTYLGDDLFEEMVKGYIYSTPSSFRSLRNFADALPRFLAITEPFSDHLILSELAAFERMLKEAFDAPESERLGTETLQQLPAEDWPLMRLRFHPSVQLFVCHSNCVESWQHLKVEKIPPQPEVYEQPRYWLLWRNAERLTEFRSLSAPEYVAMHCFLNGSDFSNVCEELLDELDEREIAPTSGRFLMDWLYNGLVSRLVTG